MGTLSPKRVFSPITVPSPGRGGPTTSDIINLLTYLNKELRYIINVKSIKVKYIFAEQFAKTQNCNSTFLNSLGSLSITLSGLANQGYTELYRFYRSYIFRRSNNKHKHRAWGRLLRTVSKVARAIKASRKRGFAIGTWIPRSYSPTNQKLLQPSAAGASSQL